MEIKYPKWILNTTKLVNNIILNDIPDNISATAELTDLDKELIFEFKDLY